MKKIALSVVNVSKFLKYKFTLSVNFAGTPMLGDQAQVYIKQICTGKDVLEYGSGNSTFWLAGFVKTLTTVESDKKIALALRKKLGNECRVLYANIGPTKSFGQPLKIFSILFSKRYLSYPSVPFFPINQPRKWDVVIVDGRFRVATALTCINNLKHGFTLIVDDYADRPEYWVLQDTLRKNPKIVDGTAFFEIGASSHFPEYSKLMDEFALIPD